MFRKILKTKYETTDVNNLKKKNSWRYTKVTKKNIYLQKTSDLPKSKRCSFLRLIEIDQKIGLHLLIAYIHNIY